MRLQKIIAQAGVASRREAERMILEGRIRLNGSIVTELGTKADPLEDSIEVDGREISSAEKKVYYLLNKPTGYVTTMRDPRGRPTVNDLMVSVSERVYPVGRLDYDTSGLLIMTNDGDLAHALAHPGKEIKKYYEAKVQGEAQEKDLNRLREGIRLDDGLTAPAVVTVLKTHGNKQWLEIVIHEGKNRQVRRMCDAIGLRVVKLQRLRLGTLELNDLPLGKFRKLTDKEVDGLKALVP